MFDPSWHTAAKGTVAISLPFTVSLRDDHVLLLGQHASPGKHLHSASRFSHSTAWTAGESVAKRARDRRPALEENMMAMRGGLDCYRKVVQPSKLFCTTERKDLAPDSCMIIAQIGPEPTGEIIYEC